MQHNKLSGLPISWICDLLDRAGLGSFTVNQIISEAIDKSFS